MVEVVDAIVVVCLVLFEPGLGGEMLFAPLFRAPRFVALLFSFPANFFREGCLEGAGEEWED